MLLVFSCDFLTSDFPTRETRGSICDVIFRWFVRLHFSELNSSRIWVSVISASTALSTAFTFTPTRTFQLKPTGGSVFTSGTFHTTTPWFFFLVGLNTELVTLLQTGHGFSLFRVEFSSLSLEYETSRDTKSSRGYKMRFRQKYRFLSKREKVVSFTDQIQNQ